MARYLRLMQMAENVVARTLAALPEEIRMAAEECSVSLELAAEEVAAGDEEAEELLGLFEGLNRLQRVPHSLEDLPRIRLFVDNIWWEAGEEEGPFRQEVRTTFLHELGHYLGWDEDQVAALGLG